MHRRLLPLILTPLFLVHSVGFLLAMPKEILVIGDSLSREYQAEFPEFSNARNWVEILAENRDSTVSFGAKSGDLYDFNKAVPTFTADDYRDAYVDPSIAQLLFRAYVNDDVDTVDGAVIFLGGNDIDRVYHSSVGSINSTIEDIADNIAEIAEELLDENDDLEIVIVNVPHVGATPTVKTDPKTTPTNTQRITDGLTSLDVTLRNYANANGFGYADIFSLTLDLIEPEIFCIGGYPFLNESTDLNNGSDDGNRPYVWLGGGTSDNFHPNTQAQAVIANAIAAAFNETFSYGIPLFSNREIVEDLVGLDFDLAYEEWASNFTLSDPSLLADPDHDQILNIFEFALDLDPSQVDSAGLPGPQILREESQQFLTLHTPLRDQECAYVSLWVQRSTNLTAWSDVDDDSITINPDGSLTYRELLNEQTSKVYLRLTASLVE